MVAVRDTHLKTGFNLQEWTDTLPLAAEERDTLHSVFAYCQTRLGETDSEAMRLASRSAEMVGILLTLHMDMETLRAAILYPHVEAKHLTLEQAEDDFGPTIAQLLKGVIDMEAIRFLQSLNSGDVSDTQIDNVRRMLLAMVEDVRAVVIKLAERIACLREVKNADEETRVLVAKEITNIYAPLANRLGIGQLKWELEDLSFRYLHPETYKQIAKLLDEKRLDRERYIHRFVEELKQALQLAGVQADVYGRPKHIYSIWRKMQKKQLSFSDLYDVRAVRVIAHRLQDCYAALGISILHNQWNTLSLTP